MNHKNAASDRKGIAITSMVFGILSVLCLLLWFFGITFGLVAVVLGVISIKSTGKGMAIAGIVTGATGVALSIGAIGLFMVTLPAMQIEVHDAERKDDVDTLSSDIAEYTSDHGGALPTVGRLDAREYAWVDHIFDTGSPTLDTVIYKMGQDCAGSQAASSYSVSILLENKEIYCAGQ